MGTAALGSPDFQERRALAWGQWGRVAKSQIQLSDFTFTFLSYVFGGKEYMRIEASAQFCREPVLKHKAYYMKKMKMRTILKML